VVLYIAMLVVPIANFFKLINICIRVVFLMISFLYNLNLFK
jgi:hypothetical protein